LLDLVFSIDSIITAVGMTEYDVDRRRLRRPCA
jgi:predicted tellurium resistance membrane protein TerC